mgnify:CR=1 FL=1
MVKNTLTSWYVSKKDLFWIIFRQGEAWISINICIWTNLTAVLRSLKMTKSNKMGKKDIMKIECPIDFMDLDILGFIDHNITVNIIKNSAIVDKKALHLPHEIRNVIHCKNPRCITSIEQGLDHIFVLTDPEKEVYRCKYCEEKYDGRRK